MFFKCLFIWTVEVHVCGNLRRFPLLTLFVPSWSSMCDLPCTGKLWPACQICPAVRFCTARGIRMDFTFSHTLNFKLRTITGSCSDTVIASADRTLSRSYNSTAFPRISRLCNLLVLCNYPILMIGSTNFKHQFGEMLSWENFNFHSPNYLICILIINITLDFVE